MVPPAPGLFSTSTGWPSRAESSLDTVRAITSVALPGVKATTRWTGLSGQVWAWTVLAAIEVSTSQTAASKRRIVSSRCFSFPDHLLVVTGQIQVSQCTLLRQGEMPTPRRAVTRRETFSRWHRQCGYDTHADWPPVRAVPPPTGW